MHTNVFADNSVKEKPNVVTSYISNKWGVDIANQMQMKYILQDIELADGLFMFFTTSLALLHWMLR